MKKLLLLGSFLTLTAFSLEAQLDTLFIETFEGPDSVTTYPAGDATGTWNDTSFLSISGPNSYHAKVEPANSLGGVSEVNFATNSFSTLGYDHIYLEFYNIAKLYQANAGLLRISTDGGTTWTQFLSNNVNYFGKSPNWNSSPGFQEASYNVPGVFNDWFSGTDPVPQCSWWKRERLDISDLALGPNGTGYASVQIEFSAAFTISPTQLPPPATRPFGAGWFVDNVLIMGGISCEPFPPTFRFDYQPIPCFPIRPEGGLTENQSGNYQIGAQITDSLATGSNSSNISGIDSATVHYRVINSSGVGAWQYVNMTVTNATTSEFAGTIPNISLGDTVEYYYEAVDLGCGNKTRVPNDEIPCVDPYFKFWPQQGLPFKCGTPDCGSLPGTISSFPWVENFEGAMWQAGQPPGDNGTAHRGDFPDEQQGQRYWQVQPPTSNTGYAWSIMSGTTGTPFTGPNGNHTPGGSNYIYAESSQGGNNATTTLVTPCIDLTSVTKCYALEFYYHFFGEDIGTMRIDIDTGSNSPAWYNGYYFVRKEQQKSQSDPWERALVPLKQFNGKFIRIRFLSAKQTTKTGANIRGDMAFDDLRIYEPTPVDAELLAVTGPEKGLCSYGTEDVEIVVRNNGCDSLTSLPVQYRLYTNGTPGAVQNATAILAMRTGDTSTFVIPSAVNMSALNTYQVEAWANSAQDTVSSNDTAISPDIIHRAGFNTFPFIMDFENAPVGSNQTGNTLFVTETGLDSNFRWLVGERFTSTRNTGPKHGYYGKGKYMYSESTNSTGNVNTYLVTERCVDFTGINNPTLDFYYHMWGANTNGIEVQVNEPSTMGADNWVTVPGSLVSISSQNSPVSDYLFKRVSLNAYSGDQVKIRIVAKRQGAGDLADIAVDKVMLYDRIANDGGVELVFNFNGNPVLSLPANEPVTNIFPQSVLRANVDVRNFGTSNLSNETITVTVTPMCGPNAGTPTTYTSQAGTPNITAGNATTFNMNSMALQLPEGLCEICAYTSVTGDNNTFNDTACRYITGRGSLELDFFDDFENCSYEEYGFFAQAGYLQWERDEPIPGSTFSSPQNRGTVWGTNLGDGYFLDGLEERLLTPALKIPDSVVKPTIRFYQNVQMGNNAAGKIEYNASGWKTLGSNLGSFTNVGQNWYANSIMGTLSSPVNGIDQGFTGSSQGWKYSEFPMASLNRNGNFIPFRFVFKSNTNANAGRTLGGWAIDDFEMIIPPQHSASPDTFRFDRPLQIPNNDQEMRIIIRNTGAQLLDTCQVKAEVLDIGTGNIDWQGNWETVDLPSFFIEGSTFGYDYTEAWPASDVESGDHILRLVTRRPNNRPNDDRPIDDTVEYVVTVLPEFYYGAATDDTSYCNDFETGTGSLPFLPLNSRNFASSPVSWENGTPTQFPGAFSGTNAWMTDLDANYRSLDNSCLITPVFVVEPDTNYEMTFMHYFETEKYHDGGAVEVSLDGGLNWETLGFANEVDWYNTEFVTSLDIINPGWTDTSGGWDSARYVFSFDTASTRAVFRFRFESDYAIQRPGWAIDDFCLKMTTAQPKFEIGNEEFNPTPGTYVGTLNPNPTADVTHLPIFVGQSKEVSVEIVNVVGQRVFDSEYILDKGTNSLQFETFEWRAGVYFVNINIDGERLTRKLVVQ